MKRLSCVLPRGVPIEIWFQDEARVGQKNGITRQWATKGSRPRQPKDQRYTALYIFGAVCPQRDIGAALVMPYADTKAMQLHLEEISRNVAKKAHAIVIMDGAGWHTTGKLKIPDNISLMILPPYSPELNPVENIWQYLRQNWLSNRVYKDYDHLLDATCQAWNNLCAIQGKISQIAQRSWAT